MRKLSARGFARRYLKRPASIAAEHDILTFSLVLKAKPTGDDGELEVSSLATVEQIGVGGAGKTLLVEQLAAIVARLQQELALQQSVGLLAVATYDVSAVQNFTTTMTALQPLVSEMQQPANEALPDDQP